MINTETDIKQIFETFLDDMLDNASAEELRGDAVEKMISADIESSYTHVVQIQFNRIQKGTQARSSDDAFIRHLKDFDKDFKDILDMCPFLDRYDDRLTYMLLNETWNDNDRNKGAEIMEFDIDGLHFYNVVNFNGVSLTDVSNFDVRFLVIFEEFRPSQLVRFLKWMLASFRAVISKTFPGADLSFVQFTDRATGTISKMDYKKMLDITRALDTPGTVNSFKRLYRNIYGQDKKPNTEEVFNKNEQTYSTFCQTLLKRLRVWKNPQDFFISETPETLFFTIPKGKTLKLVSWDVIRMTKLMQKFGKRILLTVEGTLSVTFYSMRKNEYYYGENGDIIPDKIRFNKLVRDIMYPTVNEMDVTFECTEQDLAIDFSSLFINKLTVTFKNVPWWLKEKESIDAYKAPTDKLIFNAKPKSLKIIDLTKNKKK